MLFTFPSRYSYAIGQTGIFRLTPRSGPIHTGFHESRATWEQEPAGGAPSATGPSPSTAGNSIPFASHAALSLPPGPSEPGRQVPQHPCRNPRRVSHGTGLAIIRFRSPLLTEYPFLQVLRCFTSLRTPRTNAVPAHHGRRVTPFGHPRIKALSAAPRGLSRPHASFIGPVCQGIHHAPLPTTRPQAMPRQQQLRTARRQIITLNDHKTIDPNPLKKIGSDETIQQTTSPKAGHPLASTIQFSNHQHTDRTRRGTNPTQEPDGQQEHHPQGWRSGNPTAHPCHSLKTVPRQHAHTIRPSGRTRRHDPHASHAGDFHNLRRKEVIQPHLPVRLPCYDLVPIADLTLDGSPPNGLGHRLRVLPTFMT